jgi:hypothetical protein
LSGANLSGANLSGANLRRAALSEANFTGAKGILIFNKENGRTCYAVIHDTVLYIKAGCFWGTISEFEKKCISTYGDDKKQNYHIQIAYLKAIEESLKEI